MGMSTTQAPKTETLGCLVFKGLSTELSYLTTDEAEAARTLEAELIADAQAGVDLRIRLIAVNCSR